MNSVFGCIVIYESQEYQDNLDNLLAAVDHLLIIDNSEQLIADSHHEKITVIHNQNRGGIAGALNRALAFCKQQQVDFLFLLDQDSIITPNIVAVLKQEMEISGAAVIGPKYLNSATKKPGMVILDNHGRPSPDRLTDKQGTFPAWFVINSGSLIDIRRIDDDLIYDEKLYVDSVDIDFCLQLRQRNKKVMVTTQVEMLHGIGNKDSNASHLTPTNYSAFRYQILARSKRLLWRKWFTKNTLYILFDMAIWLLDAARVIAFSKNRLPFIKSTVKGLFNNE